jgi:hypothetical protein
VLIVFLKRFISSFCFIQGVVYRVTLKVVQIFDPVREPHKIIMPYTNVDIFREKGAQSFSKKVWEPLNFMKK